MKAKTPPNFLTCYKATRHDGTDFYTGTFDYAKAMAAGVSLEEPNADTSTEAACGRGLHVSPTPRLTCRYLDSAHRPYRWFEVQVDAKTVIGRDDSKLRVHRIERVVKELTLADIFGPDFAARIGRVRDEVATWKAIPWLKPEGPVTDKQLRDLFGLWHASISPWWRDKTEELPTAFKVIRDRKAAADADAAAAAADADAAADAADADAAADAANAAADAAAAADDADAAAADADAAAAAADADAAADAADAADAAAAAARVLPWWWRRYVKPRYVLLRMARWEIAGMEQPNPWTPMAAMYRLGCLPIGYCKVDGKTVFAVYCPVAGSPKN